MIIFIHTYVSFLHQGSSAVPACSGWKAVNTLDGTSINHRADTQYHSNQYTFTSLPWAHLHLGHNILRAQRLLFWNTCCTCLRWGMEGAYQFSYLSPQLRTWLHVRWHFIQKVQMRRDRFWGKSHGPKNSFKRITASNLVFPIHLSWSGWTVAGKKHRNIGKLHVEMCRGFGFLKEL